MTVSFTTAVALRGIDGVVVTVEVNLAQGLPGTTVIGLGDAAVTQARDRIHSALGNCGEKWPERKVTLALSPASLPKRGAGFDLAMAVAVMVASGSVTELAVHGLVLIGELGLDGRIRPVPGVLPSLLGALRAGFRRALVPVENLAEAALVEDIEVLGAGHLRDVLVQLRGTGTPLIRPRPSIVVPEEGLPDLRDVLGQPEGRAALEVAAAGGHHLAMVGPPGAGKTMLATRLPGLLPELTREQAIEVTAVHSVGGILAEGSPLVVQPPFIDPHHTATEGALVGGGGSFVRPGSISLAHHGILFLDEAPEFSRRVLDSLRQPMESGEVLIARASSVTRYPARFQLIIAANPCPCAAAKDVDCRCAADTRRRYLNRLSGPLMDRVDIRVDLPALDPLALNGSGEVPEDSATVRARVLVARDRAAVRWRGSPWSLNAQVPGPVLRRYWRPGRSELALLDRAARSGLLTGRGYERVMRLALTCADLRGLDQPALAEVSTALGLRSAEAA